MSVYRSDHDYLVIILSLSLVVALAAITVRFSLHYEEFVPQPIGATKVAADPRANPAGHAHEARMKEIDSRFHQAVAMLHARRYDMAITALHRVLQLSPRLPEAHLNMGYALYGAENYTAARDFFDTAIELDPYSANAYYGLAEASAALDDYGMAIGAMSSYLHLRKDAKMDDKFVNKARALLTQWQAKVAPGSSSGGRH